MLELDKKVRRFKTLDLEFQISISPSLDGVTYSIYPSLNSKTAYFNHVMSFIAPGLEVYGVLEDSTGINRIIKFSPNVAPADPTLTTEIYTSTDGVTYNLLTSVSYDQDVEVTTNAQYVVGIVRDPDGRVLYSTDDEKNGIYPVDPRNTYVEVRLASDKSLKYELPVFYEPSTGRHFASVAYRSVNDFRPIGSTIDTTDEVTLLTRDTTSEPFDAAAKYWLTGIPILRNYIFPLQSPKVILGLDVVREFDIFALTEFLAMLSILRTLDDRYESEFMNVMGMVIGLPRDSNGLLYEKYDFTGTPLTDEVNVSYLSYMAARFVATGDRYLLDFVLTDDGSSQGLIYNLDAIKDSVTQFLPDRLTPTGTVTDYHAFTEVFWLLALDALDNYYGVNITSVDRDILRNNIESLVDTSVFHSWAEKNGATEALPRTSYDIISLAVYFKPIDQAKYQNAMTKLFADYWTSQVNIPLNTDPNDPNYNPEWEVIGQIYGFSETVAGVIDSRPTYLLRSFADIYNDPTYFSPAFKDGIERLKVQDGVLRVASADAATDRYIVPDAYSTFVDVTSSASSMFISPPVKRITYANCADNPVTLTLTPANNGVIAKVSITVASPFIVFARGTVTGRVYDFAIVETPVTYSEVFLKIVNPPESVEVRAILLQD